MKPHRRYFFYASFLLSSSLLSCSAEYFHTANDLYKTAGTVYFKDGTERKGLLTVLLENGIEVNETSISFTPAGSQKEEHLRFTDIASYAINGTRYVPRNINLYTADTNRALFVKMLSDEKAKMQLFELEQRRKSSDTGEERNLYFISVPSYSATDLIELHSNQMVPLFDEKMSAFVADCPGLAARIRNKESAYYYTYLSPEAKKLDVIKRIISDYNKCSAK